MDISNLEKVLSSEPAFRIKQAKEAIFKNLIENWQDATFFSKDLREVLNKECPLSIKADILVSKEEDTIKAKITLKDNLEIETVLMRHEDNRNTVCVSSQVGCPLGCGFCATGMMGFKRNLDYLEIVEQVLFFERYLKKENQRVSNVVFMGMGEPFLNYENVLKAIRHINGKEGFNIGARSISVSTAGVVEGIKRFSEEGLQVNLAFSLHAPNDELRSSLMPINKKYPLKEVLLSIDEYIKKTKRQVMIEYMLIKDVNDSNEDAKELANIVKRNNLYFLNLILYNQTGRFEPSSFQRVKEFKNTLTHLKINFSQRYRFGDDIKAACGQFITDTK